MKDGPAANHFVGIELASQESKDPDQAYFGMERVLPAQKLVRPPRLQLKRGLFWYRHYPKLHQIVKYRSSRAEFWTNLRQISMRVFVTAK